MCTQNYYSNFENSPMFKLSLSSKELFHSNFLEWLSTLDKDKTRFKRLILQMAGVERGKEEDDPTWRKNWLVKREYNNFDLCIVEADVDDCTEGDDKALLQGETNHCENDKEQLYDGLNGKILFVLENKVKSIPYKEQLVQYSTEAEGLNRKYYYKEATNKVANAKKVQKIDGSWYEYSSKKTWNKWNDQKNDWEEYGIKLERKIESSKKTDFYQYYIDKQSYTKTRYILLSLAEIFPDKPNGNEAWTFDITIPNGKNDPVKTQVSWEIVNYCQYVNIVKEQFVENDEQKGELSHLIIEDYCGFVKNLSDLAVNWKNNYQDENPFLHFEWVEKENEKHIRVFKKDFIDAREHRIHDLYQKLKYSYFCTHLYNLVKGLCCVKNHSMEVYPTNQGGLFKDKKDKNEDRKTKSYICVNYTYLHGEPLLEVNIHPRFDYDDGYEIYYAIQVQGGVYEHGYQVRKWKDGEPVKVTAAEVWEELIKDNKSLPFAEKWMRLPRTEDFNTDWAKSHNDVLEKEILPMRKNPEDDKPKLVEKGNKRVETKNGYNKYDMNDSTYIYQSRRIENHATIGQVIGLMLKDVEKVVELL